MNKKLIALSIIAMLAVAGCGGDTSTPDSDSGGGLLSNLGGSQYLESDDLDDLEACELLTMDIVTSNISNVPEDIEPFDFYGCIYEWPKSNAEEIEEANSQKIMEVGLSNITSLNLQSEDNIVGLSYNTFALPQSEEAIDKTYRSLTNQLTQEEQDQASQALKDAFDSIGSGDETDQQVSEQAEEMGVGDAVQDKLEEGFTEGEKDLGNSLIDLASQTSDEDVYVEVDGLGDRAAWSEYSKDLVVQYKNFFFNLNVDLEESSQDAAVNIAKEVLQNLKSEL